MLCKGTGEENDGGTGETQRVPGWRMPSQVSQNDENMHLCCKVQQPRLEQNPTVGMAHALQQRNLCELANWFNHGITAEGAEGLGQTLVTPKTPANIQDRTDALPLKKRLLWRFCL